MTTTIFNRLEGLLSADYSSAALSRLQTVVRILLNREPGANAERMAMIAFAIRIVSAALAFLSQIIFARTMGEFEYGIFVFVWVFVIISGNLSCLGFHTSIIKFVPQYQATDDLDHIRGLTIASRIVVMVVASTMAILGVASVFLFQDKIPSYYLAPIILGACAMPMIALGDMLDGTARAHSWPIAALSPTFIIRPGLIITFMIVAILSGFEPTAETALLCAIAATYLTTLGQLTLVKSKLTNTYEAGKRRWDFHKWINVALPIFVVESLYYLLTNSDVIIVGFYLEPDQVAVYFAAAKTMALVHFIYFAVKASAGPKFAKLAAANDIISLDKSATQLARWTFIPTLLMGGLVLVLGQLILSMFGNNFKEGLSVIFILFSGILLKSMIGPGEVLLMMFGKQRICAFIYAIAFASNLVLNMSLIPSMGINGAALATSTAMVIEGSLLLFVIKSQIGITMFALSNMNSKPEIPYEQSQEKGT